MVLEASEVCLEKPSHIGVIEPHFINCSRFQTNAPKVLAVECEEERSSNVILISYSYQKGFSKC